MEDKTKIYAKGFMEGFKEGAESVFEFLKEMEKVKDVNNLQKEFDGWSNADEVILPNGDRLDKSSGKLTPFTSNKTGDGK